MTGGEGAAQVLFPIGGGWGGVGGWGGGECEGGGSFSGENEDVWV